MSKILILEDRPSRQRLFLPNREKDIETLLSISGLSIPLAVDCKKIIDEINNERYLFKDTLKLLIIHKSSINSKGLMYVYKACKDQCIKIIFFSGGIAQLNYHNENLEFLNINSSDLYSARLIPFIRNFLQDKVDNLLELVYENWELTYLLQLRKLIHSRDSEIEIYKNRFDHKIKMINQILGYEKEMEEQNLNTLINKIILNL